MPVRLKPKAKPLAASATTVEESTSGAAEVLASDGVSDEGSDLRLTSPEHCRAFGGGLSEVTVKQYAFFWIEARDERSKRRRSGGDSFFVSIRGPSQASEQRVASHAPWQ